MARPCGGVLVPETSLARQRGFAWLKATLPKINAPDKNIATVGVSSSNIHAHTTANSGTRYVTVTARALPMRWISR